MFKVFSPALDRKPLLRYGYPHVPSEGGWGGPRLCVLTPNLELTGKVRSEVDKGVKESHFSGGSGEN